MFNDIKLSDVITLDKSVNTNFAKYSTSVQLSSEDFSLIREHIEKDIASTISRKCIKEIIDNSKNEYLDLIINAIIDDPDFVEFEGYTVPCVNLSLPINEKSILLSRLYTKYPPFAMSYRFDNCKLKVSLRGNGEVDLSIIAAKYGGGGHRNSCGFIVPANSPLPFAKHISRE